MKHGFIRRNVATQPGQRRTISNKALQLMSRVSAVYTIVYSARKLSRILLEQLLELNASHSQATELVR